MKKVLFIYFFCLSIPSVGQVNFDSLWNVWNDPNQQDLIRLEAIQNIAWDGYLFSQPDSAFYFAQKGYDFAKRKALKDQMAKIMNIMGVSYYVQGDYANAINYYTRCLVIWEEIGNKDGISSSLNNIGLVYDEQGDYASAIDYYTRSLIIYEEMDNKNGVAISLNNIGLIYYYQNDYVSAIDYHTRSLSIREEIGNNKGVASSLNNIGLIYDDQDDYDSAIYYYTRSLNIKKEIGDKKGIASSLNNIGLVYNKQEDHIRAIDYHTRSLSIREEISNKKGIASSLINIGSTYKEQGKYSKAIPYITRSLTIAQEIGAAIEIRNASKALYEVYRATRRYELALEVYELYIATKDSIDSEENQREVIRQEYKYKYEKQAIADSVAFEKEQKLKDTLIQVQELELEKSKIQKIALYVGVVLLLSFLGYVFYRLKKSNRQKLLIAKKNKELKDFSLIVSHDLKAPLMSVYTLTQWANKDIAEGNYKEVSSSLTLLMRQVKKMNAFIDNILKYSTSVHTKEEMCDVDIKLLINNLKELLMIPKSIVLKFDTPLPCLKISEVHISQIFQNLISNAVKYMNKEHGMINIGYQDNLDELKFYVKDNGQGIDELYLEKIFQIFQIIPENEKDQSGVGLFIVKKIIENHEGNIWAESELNVGSTFYFTLSKKYLSC